MTNLPRNPVSSLVGGGGVGEPLSSYRQSLQTPLLYRAVVLDCLNAGRFLTTEQKNWLRTKISNPEIVESIPENSLLVSVVENGSNFTNELPKIVFPIFSSHIKLPVKPGEQVWVLFTDYSGSGGLIGYWLTRIHENDNVEDPNYTHSDRRWFSTPTPPPGFPNGGGDRRGATLPPLEGNINPYDYIVDHSSGSSTMSYEPVPRYNRQPEELVLEGSHNNLMVLGHLSGAVGSGTIDLVVGRGRGGLPFTSSGPQDAEAPPSILNSRNNYETDKRTNNTNINEGKVNYTNDAARLWLGMNADADVWFKTQQSTDPISGTQYPENTSRPLQRPQNDTGANRSYAVLKADNVRIIGRKNETVDGNILLLKEGQKDDNLVFVFLDNNNIQIEAKELFFGKSKQKTEPYIKYTEYKKTVEALQNQINTLETFLQNLSNQLSVAFNSSVAIPYQTVASLLAIAPTIQTQFQPQVSQRLEPDKNTIQQSLEDCKSRKIFGE